MVPHEAAGATCDGDAADASNWHGDSDICTTWGSRIAQAAAGTLRGIL